MIDFCLNKYLWQSFFQKAGLTRTCQDNVKICGYFMFQVKYPSFEYDENYDIANAMSFSRADPVLGHCPGWGYSNI